MFINVVLPAPFSPSTAWMLPRATCRLTPSLAFSSPKLRETRSTTRWAVAVAIGGITVAGRHRAGRADRHGAPVPHTDRSGLQRSGFHVGHERLDLLHDVG